MTSNGGLSPESVDALLRSTLAQEERRLVELEARVRRLASRPAGDELPRPAEDVTEADLQAARELLERSGAQLRAIEEQLTGDPDLPRGAGRPPTEELDLEALERELKAQADRERGYLEGDDDLRAYASSDELPDEPAAPRPPAPKRSFVPPSFSPRDGGAPVRGDRSESQDHLRFLAEDDETKDHLRFDTASLRAASDDDLRSGGDGYRTDVDDFRGGAGGLWSGGEIDDVRGGGDLRGGEGSDSDELRGDERGYRTDVGDFRDGEEDDRSDVGDFRSPGAARVDEDEPLAAADLEREASRSAGRAGFAPPAFDGDGRKVDPDRPTDEYRGLLDADAAAALPAELGAAARRTPPQSPSRSPSRRLAREDPSKFALERAFGEGRGELRQLAAQQAACLELLIEVRGLVAGDGGAPAGAAAPGEREAALLARAERAERACAEALEALAARNARLEALTATLEAFERAARPGDASRRLVEVLRSGRQERSG